MISMADVQDINRFSLVLFDLMKELNCGVEGMELYEFRYALHNLQPQAGWPSIQPVSMTEIESMVGNRAFYDGIQIKPKVDGQIVLDEPIKYLSQMLMVGLATGAYPLNWVHQHFYFDIRGFYFLHRTTYLTEAVINHFGGQPYREFEPKQRELNCAQSIGYKEFKQANAEIDDCFIDLVKVVDPCQGYAHPAGHRRADRCWKN